MAPKLDMNTLPGVYKKAWSDPGPSSQYFVAPAPKNSPYLAENAPVQQDGTRLHMHSAIQRYVARSQRQVRNALKTRGGVEEFFKKDYSYEEFFDAITAFARMPRSLRFGLQEYHIAYCRVIVVFNRCKNRIGDACKLASLANMVHSLEGVHMKKVKCKQPMTAFPGPVVTGDDADSDKLFIDSQSALVHLHSIMHLEQKNPKWARAMPPMFNKTSVSFGKRSRAEFENDSASDVSDSDDYDDYEDTAPAAVDADEAFKYAKALKAQRARTAVLLKMLSEVLSERSPSLSSSSRTHNQSDVVTSALEKIVKEDEEARAQKQMETREATEVDEVNYDAEILKRWDIQALEKQKEAEHRMEMRANYRKIVAERKAKKAKRAEKKAKEEKKEKKVNEAEEREKQHEDDDDEHAMWVLMHGVPRPRTTPPAALRESAVTQGRRERKELREQRMALVAFSSKSSLRAACEG